MLSKPTESCRNGSRDMEKFNVKGIKEGGGITYAG